MYARTYSLDEIMRMRSAVKQIMQVTVDSPLVETQLAGYMSQGVNPDDLDAKAAKAGEADFIYWSAVLPEIDDAYRDDIRRRIMAGR